jgi:hypothetical protein
LSWAGFQLIYFKNLAFMAKNLACFSYCHITPDFNFKKFPFDKQQVYSSFILKILRLWQKILLAFHIAIS